MPTRYDIHSLLLILNFDASFSRDDFILRNIYFNNE